MIEVFCVGLSPYAVLLKEDKNRLCSEIRKTPADQAGELRLECAETCDALGHWYRQQGCEIPAKSEFDEANRHRQKAS